MLDQRNSLLATRRIRRRYQRSAEGFAWGQKVNPVFHNGPILWRNDLRLRKGQPTM
jgi:hypothetical protein